MATTQHPYGELIVTNAILVLSALQPKKLSLNTGDFFLLYYINVFFSLYKFRSETLNVRSEPLNVRSEPLNVRSEPLNGDFNAV